MKQNKMIENDAVTQVSESGSVADWPRLPRNMQGREFIDLLKQAIAVFKKDEAHASLDHASKASMESPEYYYQGTRGNYRHMHLLVLVNGGPVSPEGMLLEGSDVSVSLCTWNHATWKHEHSCGDANRSFALAFQAQIGALLGELGNQHAAA